MNKLFICGTDTDVGKTIVSAILIQLASMHYKSVSYHKPIQTGALLGCDADTVRKLQAEPNRAFISSGLVFDKPLSPHLAAFHENKVICLKEIVKKTKEQCNKDFNVIEGAGGLLVPINNRSLMIDFMASLEIPAVLVARSSLGTINHTLLSIMALKTYLIPLLGVIMVGNRCLKNEESIRHYGRVKNIAFVPRFNMIDSQTILEFTRQQQNHFSNFFNIWDR